MQSVNDGTGTGMGTVKGVAAGQGQGQGPGRGADAGPDLVTATTGHTPGPGHVTVGKCAAEMDC